MNNPLGVSPSKGKKGATRGRAGETIALSGKKRKLTHVTERETDILAHTQVPHSVRTSFPASFASSAGRKNISLG